MIAAALSASAEFVRLGYGPAGSLHFRVSLGSDFEEAAEIVRTVPGYNKFDPERVLDALEPIWADLSGVEFGREYSPVVYAVVPHFEHQGNGSPLHWSEPWPEPHRRQLAESFLTLMSEAGAGEVSWRGCPTGSRHVPSGFWTGAGSIPERTDKDEAVRMYALRAWWD